MDVKLIYLAKRNPAIKAEDWPRTWRSHAVFASQFPIAGVSLTGLFYCSRMLTPTLNGTPVDPPGASLGYDGVAVVSSPSEAALRAELSPADRAKIDQDELRVFSTYTPRFSFYCKEVLVHGGAHGQAAVIRFLARKAEDSREDFFAHWGRQHADIGKRAVEAGAVTRYVHNSLLDEPPPGYPFDGITETWFANADDAVRSLLDGALAPLARDVPTFCDMERTVTMLTYVTHRWPRA
ncbi:MAG: hypothetical protein EPO08_13695 [Rhodospirillaceae bacterium]|nr:MAG: hypothetical protein EPO08_13695 [Rhodospirillaceae bacterium]